MSDADRVEEPPDGLRPGERAHLAAAVRLAWRFRGHVEPNPCVGCAILDAEGRRVALAAHRRFGGPHAEALALAEAGPAARNGTAIVTLEPCAHHGKQPPCTDALLAAGVRRVVCAVADPHPEAAGGAARLAAAGVDVAWARGDVAAWRLAAPFVHRVRTGRPWVTAKWAQTIDGRIAARGGHSQWISGPRSRRMVHRARGRADAVLTGLGTVLADDPELTPRHGRPRRVPVRVVADPGAETPADGRLASTVALGPVLVAARADRVDGGDPAATRRADRLRTHGVEVLALPADPAGGEGIDPTTLLEMLAVRGATHVLVEAGGTLVGRLLAADLVQTAWVFTGPRLLADGDARPPADGMTPGRIDEAIPGRLVDLRRRGEDAVAWWRVGSAAAEDARAGEPAA